jgi:hypothetical protein
VARHDHTLHVRLLPPAHANTLLKHLRRLPAAAPAIGAWFLRILALEVEVLLVGLPVGKTPRQKLIVADNDARRAGKGRPRRLKVWASQVHFIPDNRNLRGQVRIIRQHGLAREAALGRNHPRVASLPPVQPTHPLLERLHKVEQQPGGIDKARVRHAICLEDGRRSRRCARLQFRGSVRIAFGKQ